MASADNIQLRFANEADLTDIAAIYAHYVAHSVATFANIEPTSDEWRKWFTDHSGPHPAIVAVMNDRVVGWGTLSTWNQRCAYRTTVEDSVYVHADMHRRGVGRALLGRLVELARSLDHRIIIGQIADHQAASEKLHESFGFRRVGCLEDVGFKFGRAIDVSIFQLTLRPPPAGG